VTLVQAATTFSSISSCVLLPPSIDDTSSRDSIFC
jgi:hypothetical protein